MNVHERSAEIDQIVEKPAQTASPKSEPRKTAAVRSTRSRPEAGEERRQQEREGADPDERRRDIREAAAEEEGAEADRCGAERRPETADAFARSAHGR